MRVLPALVPLMALFSGRVVTPIDGMSDPRYGFLSMTIYHPGSYLAPGFCADHSAAQFEDGPLSFNLSAIYGPFSSNFDPLSSPDGRNRAPFATQQCPNVTCPG